MFGAERAGVPQQLARGGGGLPQSVESRKGEGERAAGYGAAWHPLESCPPWMGNRVQQNPQGSVNPLVPGVPVCEGGQCSSLSHAEGLGVAGPWLSGTQY